jgi:hypothetical protein
MWYQKMSDYPVTRIVRVSDYSSPLGTFAHMQNLVNIQKRSPNFTVAFSAWEISGGTFYKWKLKVKFGGMDVSDAKRRKDVTSRKW